MRYLSIYIIENTKRELSVSASVICDCYATYMIKIYKTYLYLYNILGMTVYMTARREYYLYETSYSSFMVNVYNTTRKINLHVQVLAGNGIITASHYYNRIVNTIYVIWSKDEI
jgi:hypothetical protein